MALAGASLTIGKKTSVVTLPCIVEDINADFFEDILLVFVVATVQWISVTIVLGSESVMTPEREVKGKSSLFVVSQHVDDLGLGIGHFNAEHVVSINLGKERSNSDTNLHSRHLSSYCLKYYT